LGYYVNDFDLRVPYILPSCGHYRDLKKGRDRSPVRMARARLIWFGLILHPLISWSL